MNIRKLFDWRKVLLYSHRWLGIAGGVLFVLWFFSGIVMMYRGMPSFNAEKRLSYEAPLDLSSVTLSPAEAARMNNIKPSSLKVSMFYDGRPVYRFQDKTVFADSGELLTGKDREAAMKLVAAMEPTHAATLRYDALLEDSDQWTLSQGIRDQMPLHRIALGDAEDTYLYVSQATGEPVQKTDGDSRFWGFLGAVLHWVYFTPFRRHRFLWNQFIIWGSAIGGLMCLTGIAAGIWRFSIRGRFRQRAETSHTPYSGLMRWHHYSGLLFGLFSFTWIISGGLSVNPYGWNPRAGLTKEQRDMVAGGPFSLKPITVDSLKATTAAIATAFAPKEVDVLQFQGELYLTATDPATPNAPERRAAPSEVMVSLATPESGTFNRFDNNVMESIASKAMAGVPVTEAVWLNDYDNYFRSRDRSRQLPVLRMKYNDAEQTWVYLDPFHGTVTRQVWRNRLNRWLYPGFHSLDLPYLYGRRPLWDIAVIVLSLGGIALSATTLLPMMRRLKRHSNRLLGRKAPRRIQPAHTPVAEAARSGLMSSREPSDRPF